MYMIEHESDFDQMLFQIRALARSTHWEALHETRMVFDFYLCDNIVTYFVFVSTKPSFLEENQVLIDKIVLHYVQSHRGFE